MSTTWYAKIDCNWFTSFKNRKVGRLGRDVFLFILCVNSQNGHMGFISERNLDLEYLAEQLQMTTEEAAEGIRRCVNIGLIEVSDGLIQICGWTDDYGKRASTDADRARKYRDRQKSKGNPTNENVTPSRDDRDASQRDRDASLSANVTKCDVTQEGRKEGREGGKDRDARPDFDPDSPPDRGRLAQSVWSRLSEIRIAVAAELGIRGVMPFTPITPQSSNQKGYRDLSERIREEGKQAPQVCNRILEVLTAQAREKRSIDWLSEKAFSEGAWRHARESVPKWRGIPQQPQHATDDFPIGDCEVVR
jgi:hypothetical protein